MPAPGSTTSQADEAGRTQEWRGGVDRLGEPFAPEVEALIAPYRAILATVRERHGDAYPGSPLIMRELMRPQDRAVFVELHPEDEAVLARRFRRDAQVKVLHLDGWTALHALIPAKERRGLVLDRSALRGAGRARAPRPRDGKGACANGRPASSPAGIRSRITRDVDGPAAIIAARRARQGVAPRAHDRRAHGAGPPQRLRALRPEPALAACRRGRDDPAGARRAARPRPLRRLSLRDAGGARRGH